MATEFDPRQSETLAWVLRLPFVSAAQLALLLGDPEPTVSTALRVLARAGWLDWVDSPAPDTQAGRLYLLTDQARKWVSQGLASYPDTVAGPPPLADTEILHRLASIQSTIRFNGFTTSLAAATRCEPGVELLDGGTLPLRRRGAWWPPGVHGLVVLQHGEHIAPLFVATDHLAAPAVHRAATVAAWYSHRDANQQSALAAPIVILAAEERRSEEWSQAIVHAADRRGVLPLDILVAPSDLALPAALRARVWHTATSEAAVSLLTGLTRRRPQSITCARVASTFNGAPETLPRSVRLYEWGRQNLGQTPTKARRAQRERIAALSLAASSEQVRLLETVGRLPLLTESELALVLISPPSLLRRQLERAAQHGLIETVTGPTESRHFVLAEFGLRLLAARAGVPFRRFANHTPFLSALLGAAGGRLQTLVRQFEHTVGANSFMLACLRGSSGTATPRLVSWRNPLESVVRFESGGVRRTLRPDGAGEVLHKGRRRWFFLEWDRGTERIAILMEKLDRYVRFYGAARTRSVDRPFLLIVTTSTAREDLIWRAIAALRRSSTHTAPPVATTTDSLLERYGPWNRVWRVANGPRTVWPPEASGTPRESGGKNG